MIFQCHLNTALLSHTFKVKMSFIQEISTVVPESLCKENTPPRAPTPQGVAWVLRLAQEPVLGDWRGWCGCRGCLKTFAPLPPKRRVEPRASVNINVQLPDYEIEPKHDGFHWGHYVFDDEDPPK